MTVKSSILSQSAVSLGKGWEGQVFQDWNFPHEIVEQWNSIASQYGDKGIFLNYGWFDCWWKAFGSGKNPFVVVLQKDGETKAVFSLFTDGDHLSSMTNDHTCHYDFIVDTPFRSEAFSCFLRLLQLISPEKTIDIDYIPASADNLRLLVDGLHQKGVPFHRSNDPRAPWMNISGSWEEYFRSLPKGLRDTIKNCGNKARKMGILNLETVRNTDRLDDTLNSIFEVESKSWKGKEGSSIKCQREVEQFYSLLANEYMKKGKLLLHLLTLDGAPIAVDFCLKSGQTVFLLKTGYDEKFALLSPGVLLRSESFKYLFNQSDITAYNFLGACDQWKMRWTSLSEEYGHIKIYPKSLRGWNRYSIEHGWKDILKRSTMVRRAKNWLDGSKEVRKVH